MIIDVSRHQGVINWLAARHQVERAFIRCSMGGTGVDSQYALNWHNANQAKLLRGAYHYVVTGIAPDAQYDNIMHTTGGDFGELPLVLDAEPTGDELVAIRAGWKFPKDTYTASLLALVNNLKPHCANGLAIYTSASSWQAITVQPAWALELKLFVAHYGAVTAPDCPPDWDWWLWQYASNGHIDGIQGDVDLSRPNPALPPQPPPAGNQAAAIAMHARAIADASAS